MKKKILILGSTGFLGELLTKYFSTKKNDILIRRHGYKKKADINVDLSKIEYVKKLFKRHNFHVVINLSCFSNVDKCEENFEIAYKYNVLTARNIVKSIHKNTYLIHLSTDHVYNSLKKNFFSNENEISLTNNYSITKYLAENEILKHKNSCVVRTNFFGHSLDGKKGFIDKFIDLRKKNKLKYLVKDIYFNPVHVSSLNNLLYKLISNKKLSGVYNFGTKDGISKSSFLKKLFKIYDLTHKSLISTKYDNLKLKTPRPKNMLMDSKKINNVLKLKNLILKNEIKKINVK